MGNIDFNMATVAGQIATDIARQADAVLVDFLHKNKIFYDGDIVKTTKALRDKGMRLISEQTPFDGSGKTTTTYMIVKVIDETTVTINHSWVDPTPGNI